MTLSLQGVWEGGPERYQGQFIFTDTHYCGLFTVVGRNPIEADNPSVEEEAEAFRSLMATAVFSLRAALLWFRCRHSLTGCRLVFSLPYRPIWGPATC